MPCTSGDNNENKEVEGVDFNLYADTGLPSLVIVALGSYSIISQAIRSSRRSQAPSNPRGNRRPKRVRVAIVLRFCVIILSSNLSSDNIIANSHRSTINHRIISINVYQLYAIFQFIDPGDVVYIECMLYLNILYHYSFMLFNCKINILSLSIFL